MSCYISVHKVVTSVADSDFLQFSDKFSLLQVQSVTFSLVENEVDSSTVNKVNSSAELTTVTSETSFTTKM